MSNKYTIDEETQKLINQKALGQKLIGIRMKQGEIGQGIMHLDFEGGNSIELKWTHAYNPLTVDVIETKEIKKNNG